MTPSTMLLRRTIPGPFQLPEMASQAKTLGNETEGPPTVKTMTPDTTGAVLRTTRVSLFTRHLIMVFGVDKESSMEMEDVGHGSGA